MGFALKAIGELNVPLLGADVGGEDLANALLAVPGRVCAVSAELASGDECIGRAGSGIGGGGRGSVENTIVTGSRDDARSVSHLPYIVTRFEAPLGPKRSVTAWCNTRRVAPLGPKPAAEASTGGDCRPYNGARGVIEAFGANGWGRKRLSRDPCSVKPARCGRI